VPEALGLRERPVLALMGEGSDGVIPLRLVFGRKPNADSLAFPVLPLFGWKLVASSWKLHRFYGSVPSRLAASWLVFSSSEA